MNTPPGFFDSTSAEFARQYEHSENFRQRHRLWAELIAAHTQPEQHALDVGCGPGHLSCIAARHTRDVVGIDPSPGMLELAHARAAAEGLGNVSFELGTLDALHERKLRGDVVLCSSVLEYLPDLRQSLAVLRSSVAAGGTLIVSMPNGECLYRRVEALAYAVARRPAYRGLVKHVPTVRDFEALCAESGLRMIELRYCATSHALRLLNPVVAEHRRAALFVAVLKVS